MSVGTGPGGREASRRRFVAGSAAILVAALLLLGATRLAPRAGPVPDIDVDGCRTADWSSLVREHAARYPDIEVADAYKLLHQATMGSEHYISNRRAAADWLTREIAVMGPGPDEPLVDPLGSPGVTVRVHLRPFVTGGGHPAKLLDAFVATGDRVEPRPDLLECAIQAVLGPSVIRDLPFEADAFRSFTDERRAEGFVAVHHSDSFRRAYRPAYRVVAAELVEAAVVSAGSDRP